MVTGLKAGDYIAVGINQWFLNRIIHLPLARTARLPAQVGRLFWMVPSDNYQFPRFHG